MTMKRTLWIAAVAFCFAGCGDDDKKPTEEGVVAVQSCDLKCDGGKVCAIFNGKAACYATCTKSETICEVLEGQARTVKKTCTVAANGVKVVSIIEPEDCNAGWGCNKAKTACEKQESEEDKRAKEEKESLCANASCADNLECRIVLDGDEKKAICVKPNSICAAPGITQACENDVRTTFTCYKGAGADAGKNYATSSEENCPAHQECGENENEETTCVDKISDADNAEKTELCKAVTCSGNTECRIVKTDAKEKEAVCVEKDATCTKTTPVQNRCAQAEGQNDAYEVTKCLPGASADRLKSYPVKTVTTCEANEVCKTDETVHACKDKYEIEKEKLCANINCKNGSECMIVKPNEEATENYAKCSFGECDDKETSDYEYICVSPTVFGQCLPGAGADAGKTYRVAVRDCADKSPAEYCFVTDEDGPACMSPEAICLGNDGLSRCEDNQECVLIEMMSSATPMCFADKTAKCTEVNEDMTVSCNAKKSAIAYHACYRGVGADSDVIYSWDQEMECLGDEFCVEDSKSLEGYSCVGMKDHQTEYKALKCDCSDDEDCVFIEYLPDDGVEAVIDLTCVKKGENCDSVNLEDIDAAVKYSCKDPQTLLTTTCYKGALEDNAHKYWHAIETPCSKGCETVGGEGTCKQ